MIAQLTYFQLTVLFMNLSHLAMCNDTQHNSLKIEYLEKYTAIETPTNTVIDRWIDYN